tara:strand:+ start:1160 stop:3103 length:1944 start_codon:yes stop_codon:yes gene_type:complete
MPRVTRGRQCFKNSDCPRGKICVIKKNGTNKCEERGDAEGVKIQSVAIKDKTTDSAWVHSQGTEEIIKEAQNKVRRVKNNIDCKFDGKTQWYQNVVKKFITPGSTIDRLLVAHQLGTGKTRSMLEMIGNFYKDPRPVIVLVPKQSLVANFYDELFKHPTPLRDFLYKCLGNPPEPMTPEFRQKCIELLEKKGKIRKGVVQKGVCKNEPAAPIRCVRMTQAGSNAFRKNAIFKVSQRISSQNKIRSKSLFDSCIVMVDEGHLLVQSSAWDNASQVKNVQNLANELKNSKNTKLALLTATPVVNKREDAIKLMSIVQAKETEAFLPGYVSWFMSRVGSVFATTDPEGVLPHLIEVPLYGKNFEDYKKRAIAVRKGKAETNGLYTAEHMAAAQAGRYKSLLGMPGFEVATKLDKIAYDIKESGKKTCVMIHKSNGLFLLEELMKSKGIKVVSCASPSSGENAKKVSEQSSKKIRKFNDIENKRGENIQCIILDSAEFSEGVSLQNVRQLILADLGEGLKDPSWGRVKQRIGRALRFCSHAKLPESERLLEVYLYISTFDGYLITDKELKELEDNVRKEVNADGPESEEMIKSKIDERLFEKYQWTTLDQRKYSKLRMQVREVEMANCELADSALDKGVYGSVGCAYIPRS